MTRLVVILPAILLLSEGAPASEPKLYKVRFREGAEYCATVRLPESWQYPPDRLPYALTPGRWEMRKDATLPAPGYLIRWNGEYGDVPSNYSLNAFRFEWTGIKPEFVPVSPERWTGARKAPMTFSGNTGANSPGEDDTKITVDGRSFARTGRHWLRTSSDAILSADRKWLALQSCDGKIVHRTIFGEGPDAPLDGRIHVDVYHVPTEQRKIRLEIDQTEDQGLTAFLTGTHIYESRYLFLRVDPRPQQVYFLVCKLPAEP